jgi:hypothetical protein
MAFNRRSHPSIIYPGCIPYTNTTRILTQVAVSLVWSEAIPALYRFYIVCTWGSTSLVPVLYQSQKTYMYILHISSKNSVVDQYCTKDWYESFKRVPNTNISSIWKKPQYRDQPDMFKLVNARPILCKDQECSCSGNLGFAWCRT